MSAWVSDNLNKGPGVTYKNSILSTSIGSQITSLVMFGRGRRLESLFREGMRQEEKER
jgi:hypothetical protein